MFSKFREDIHDIMMDTSHATADSVSTTTESVSITTSPSDNSKPLPSIPKRSLRRVHPSDLIDSPEIFGNLPTYQYDLKGRCDNIPSGIRLEIFYTETGQEPSNFMSQETFLIVSTSVKEVKLKVPLYWCELIIKPYHIKRNIKERISRQLTFSNTFIYKISSTQGCRLTALTSLKKLIDVK